MLWQGWRDLYNHRHVNALASMVSTHSPGIRVVCLTDTPEGIECETHPLPPDPKVPLNRKFNCYRRLWLYSAEAAEAFPGSILSIDLDCLILRDIRPLFSGHEFRILKSPRFHFNGSLQLHRTGTRTHFWNALDRHAVLTMYAQTRRRRLVGSDQRWLSWISPEEATFWEEDGVGYRDLKGASGDPVYDARLAHLLDEFRIIFFPGSLDSKPWSDAMKERTPQIYDAYM